MKVLVVDDDVDLLDLMTYALRREGYNVLAAVDGQQALQRWESENPDIVLLDGNLPKIDGFEVCRRIRHESKTPIIMLTARDEEEDILRGLQIGADDYMTKPFSAKQLAARMKAVLRRCQTDPYRQPASEVRVGDLVLDLQSHEVTKAGKQVNGAQRYQCQNEQCVRRIFLLQYQDRGRIPEIRRPVVDMALSGSGIRDTARVLRMSPTTVIAVLKKSRRAATGQPHLAPRTSSPRPRPPAARRGAR